MALVWRVVKPDGSVAYVALSPSREAIERFKSWLAARSAETSTHLGGGLLAIGEPLISQQLLTSIVQFQAGDYVGFITTLAPLIVGTAGAVRAIITPEQPDNTRS